MPVRTAHLRPSPGLLVGASNKAKTPRAARRPPVRYALFVARGTRRMLRRLNFSTITELPLLSGRRADIVALAMDGTIFIVEIKSSIEDFRADIKWRDYRTHCDRLFFAIPETVPSEIMPEEAGLILADAYGAVILRESPEHRMAAAARRSIFDELPVHHSERTETMTLDGQRIVILGGSSGIGLATAQAAAKEDASVVIASSRKPRLDEALATLPAGAKGYALDLTDEKAVKVLFAGLGPFDHLVFTAGETLQLGRLADTDIAAARGFFGLRYWGAYMAAKYGCGSIRPGGSIVFTSGLAGNRPHAGWSLGASICSAMEGLTRALAVELAPIRVNIVSPGVVKSPLWANMTEADCDVLFRQTGERLPVGHVGEVEEIAQAYLYLMQQTYGTGQVLRVDGGGTLV
jgi:NAD(P)-dependent dehydrogenase (short-subunit alcohol dehydrogenase family)